MKLFAEFFLKNTYFIFTNKYFRAFAWIIVKYGSAKRFQKRSVSFLHNHLEVPDVLSFIWQYKEIYVDESYKFSSDSPNPIIIDCGTNIGMSCLYFKSIYPTANITGFEADASIATLCKENLMRNGITDVSIIPKAVWVNDAGVYFEEDGADGGKISNEQSKAATVSSVRLKDVLLQYEKIAMLKMDIEGAEYSVLEDCASVLSRIDHLFIEFHSFPNQPQHLADLMKIMADAGFRLYIKEVNNRKSPLANQGKEKMMDVQLNIFAYQPTK